MKMTKPIMIDNVDVSECKFYEGERLINCGIIGNFGCKGHNCLFKQLQRLKAENEKLKKQINDAEKYIDELQDALRDMELDKENNKDRYRKALEEVKRLLTIAMEEETVSYLHFELIEKSIKEINKVLK